MVEHRDGRTTDTRQLILKEAERLYYAGGYDKISLQVIADQLGISKAALFHHFKNKQELFFEMLFHIVEHMRQMFAAAVEGSGLTTREKLTNIMVRWAHEPTFDVMRFLREDYYQLTPEQQREIGEAWFANTLTVVKGVFEEGIERGTLRPHNTTLSANLFLNMCILLPHPDNPMRQIMEHAHLKEYANDMLGMLLDGLTDREENAQKGK